MRCRQNEVKTKKMQILRQRDFAKVLLHIHLKGERLMSGRHYVIDNRNKKLNGNFKATVRESAAIIYLRTSNNYTAAKEDQDDGKRAIISVSIIIAFLFFFTMYCYYFK